MSDNATQATADTIAAELERLTTAAAIDRLVHHSVILELNVPSYRVETAKQGKSPPRSETTSPPQSTS